MRAGEAADSRDAVTRNVASSASVLARSAWEWSLSGGGGAVSDRPDRLRLEAFAAAQSIGVSSASRALARSGARLAAGAAGLAPVAERWETVNQELSALDKRFVDAASIEGGASPELRAELDETRRQLDAELAEVEATLQRDYPAFFELVRPSPVSVEALQATAGVDAAMLGPEEALVLLTAGFDRWNGLVFVVTKEGFEWAEIPLDFAALSAGVRRLRGTLDPGNAADGSRGADESRAPLTGTAGAAAQSGTRGYDRRTAKALYDALFGAPEIARLLADKPNWILVPQGPLLSLPFAALVTETPQGHDADPAALRETSWLGLERSLSVLPSVSSLRTLRVLPRAAAAGGSSPFFGLGDPDFQGGAGEDRSVAGFQQYFRGSTADVEAVRGLARLPGTRDEVLAMAGLFEAGPESYLLGPEASEQTLVARSADEDLASASVVLLATHGLVSGEFTFLAEPALALTPPPANDNESPSGDNDGLLTASEAAALRLNADWLILSACNTAAGGEPGADGLSGLARSFFYAGARSLLVSHWRVRDDAAVRLTTGAVERWRAGASRADAFRASMRALMADTSLDATSQSFAHPAAWAPFTLVGVERR